MNHLPIAVIVWPLMMAIFLLLARRAAWGRRYTPQLTLFSQAVQILLALLLIRAVADGEHLVYLLGHWPAPFGIVLVVDRLAAWLVLLTACLAWPVLLYALHGEDQRGRHFHMLYQLQLFGLYGAFLTGDLFNLFVFFEVLLLASYGLMLHGGGLERTRAGLHFVVMNLVGSALFLLAAGLFYGLLGTLNLADIARRVGTLAAADQGWLAVAGLLLLVVFALKSALLPLHAWLPAAYAGTSAPVAALFAIMTKVGAYAILRMHSLVFGDTAGPLAGLYQDWLLPLALLTLLAGVLGALAAGNLRRQIAYLVVASVGTLLTAFALGSVAAVTAGLYYLPHATLSAAAFFLLADSVRRHRGAGEDRFQSAPALRHRRVLGALFFVIAVLMAGLPPLSGFIGKFLLLQASLAHEQRLLILAWILGASLLTVIALARSGSLLFYHGDNHDCSACDHSQDRPLLHELLPLILLVSATLAMLIWAAPLLDYTQATAAQILHPQGYIEAVLGNGGESR